jgi:hypothetical protein
VSWPAPAPRRPSAREHPAARRAGWLERQRSPVRSDPAPACDRPDAGSSPGGSSSAPAHAAGVSRRAHAEGPRERNRVPSRARRPGRPPALPGGMRTALDCLRALSRLARGRELSYYRYRARRCGRWDGGLSETQLGTHENPFRWSRGGLINTSSVPGPRRRQDFCLVFDWIRRRCCIARPRRCARTRRRPVPEGASGVRTIARKSHCSGLNSSPTPGREGVRIRAVSARFEPFRAVLDRFGPESHGRNDRFGPESTPCDLDCDRRALKYLLGEASIGPCNRAPRASGVFGGQFVARTRGRALLAGSRANTPVPGGWCRLCARRCRQHPRRPVYAAGHPPAAPAACDHEASGRSEVSD